MRLLLAADAQSDSADLRRYLEAQMPGIDVAVHAVGEGPADAILIAQPDVVVLQIVSVDTRTVTLLEEIADLEPDLPIIVFSSVHDDEHVVQCMRHGAYDFIAAEKRARLPFTLRRGVERRHLLEEKHRAEQRASMLKTAFVANISHEIRTPLNIILGYISLLQDELPGELQQRTAPYFTSIEQSSDRLIKTISEILDISSIQAGTFAARTERFRVKPLVESHAHDFARRAQDAGLALVHTDIDDAVMVGDRFSFEQTLIHLLDNAIKFTPRGSITISARATHDDVVIVIQDTGVGIAPDFLPRIFDTFTQEVTGYSRPFEGLGLGLALVRSYLAVNQGSIDVQSEKDKGTTVTMRYPIRTDF